MDFSPKTVQPTYAEVTARSLPNRESEKPKLKIVIPPPPESENADSVYKQLVRESSVVENASSERGETAHLTDKTFMPNTSNPDIKYWFTPADPFFTKFECGGKHFATGSHKCKFYILIITFITNAKVLVLEQN